VAKHETSWTLIRSAQAGVDSAREEFARVYEPVVRAYFGARWTSPPLKAEIDDGVQDVFVDCLRGDGALGRSDPERPFRPFLFGVARTVALRFEQRAARGAASVLDDREFEARETRSSVVFDRALAMQVMREATGLQIASAQAEGGVKLRRAELLELRFQRGLSIAEIAKLWNEDAARVHHLYSDAREDFRAALREVVARRSGVPPADLERECDWMLEVLRR
jgi:RNA polymerase sigma factor (sigma-70 family)